MLASPKRTGFAGSGGSLHRLKHLPLGGAADRQSADLAEGRRGRFVIPHEFQ